VIVSVALTECEIAPLVPVTVNVPWSALAAVLTVSVEVPEAATGFLEKVALAPEGRPAAESATLPVNPLWAEMLTESVVDFPCFTVREPGEIAMVKSGAARITREADAEWTIEPPFEEALAAVQLQTHASSNSCDELGKLERLGEIVDRSEFQASDLRSDIG
jgi:hypothetical protein